jgi:hypothetical protein
VQQYRQRNCAEMIANVASHGRSRS